MRQHEIFTLDEHPARATAGVVDPAMIGFEHRHQQFDHAGRGVEFAAAFAFCTGETSQEIFVGATQEILFTAFRIAQYSEAGPEYFLGDALGSVRQLVDANGDVTLAKDYKPYGEALTSAGSGATSYGYSGEMTDATGLIYLRARYFAPQSGRFLTKDVWPGEYTRPLSLNGWIYVAGNPVNQT